MCFKLMGIGAIVFALILGCGKKEGNNAALTESGVVDESSFHYAFSGKVLNAETGEVIPDFSVALVNKDSSVKTIVNGLGSKDGVFHVSRALNWKDLSSMILPMVVSAPGFQPSVQNVTVGSDCKSFNCIASQLLNVYLKPTATTPAIDPNALANFNPANVSSLLNGQGSSALIGSLLQSGKLDPNIANLLGGASGGANLSNILVMLNGSSGSSTSSIVSMLLGMTGGLSGGSGQPMDINKLIQMGMSAALVANPQMAGALIAVQVLLPYLSGIINKQGATLPNNGMSQILASLLGGANVGGSSSAPFNISSLLGLIPAASGGGGSANFAQLAGTLLPLFTGMMKPSAGASSNPFDSILASLLKNPSLLGAVSGGTGATGQMGMLLGYLQPMIQGLNGGNSQNLSVLFNTLLKQYGAGGIPQLQNQSGMSNQFSALIPYLAPMIQGMGGKDASALTAMLTGLASQQNPAGTLQGLMSQGTKSADWLTVVSSLFPGMQNVTQTAVPGKQVLVTQLLQGLMGGNFSNVKVTQDLTGIPGVVLSGNASDILKLAQLANVDKVIALPAK